MIKSFHVESANFSEKPAFEQGVLSVPSKIPVSSDLIVDSKVRILTPQDHDLYVNTIMDILPISAKVLGRLGEGITHTFTGVYVMVTGVDEDGRQMHEFGSSEGELSKQLILDRAGTPGQEDLILWLDFLIKGGQPFDRKLPMAVFESTDAYVDELRRLLKALDGQKADEKHEYYNIQRPGKTKVVLIKQVAGQGAMYDNMLFPEEPSGVGGLSIIDMANMPMVLTPNEYRDGALRAMV